MWGKTRRIKSAKVDTLVGQDTRIEGDIIYTGGLHVEGKIVGNVRTDEETDAHSIMILSEHGVIEGEVRVANLLLNGQVIGDVHSSGHVELAESAKLQGNLYYNTLEMATGAEINGKMVHKVPGPSALLEHQRSEPVEAESKAPAAADDVDDTASADPDKPAFALKAGNS